MAAATSTAVLQQAAGASVVTAYPQVGGTAQNLDLIQILDEGFQVLLNVDFAGVVRKPSNTPSANIGNTRVGAFQTRLTSGTTAQLFADAFSNPSNQDIIQVINIGGNISYWLDATGVAHGS
jgi:hypothetical protein